MTVLTVYIFLYGRVYLVNTLQSELKSFMLLVGADLSKFYLFSVVYNLTAT
jgi:hypothetical protein